MRAEKMKVMIAPKLYSVPLGEERFGIDHEELPLTDTYPCFYLSVFSERHIPLPLDDSTLTRMNAPNLCGPLAHREASFSDNFMKCAVLICASDLREANKSHIIASH